MRRRASTATCPRTANRTTSVSQVRAGPLARRTQELSRRPRGRHYRCVGWGDCGSVRLEERRLAGSPGSRRAGVLGRGAFNTGRSEPGWGCKSSTRGTKAWSPSGFLHVLLWQIKHWRNQVVRGGVTHRSSPGVESIGRCVQVLERLGPPTIRTMGEDTAEPPAMTWPPIRHPRNKAPQTPTHRVSRGVGTPPHRRPRADDGKARNSSSGALTAHLSSTIRLSSTKYSRGATDAP